MWNPFRRKDALPVTGSKAASFLFGMGAWRSSLSGASYDILAAEGYAANAIVNACVNRIANSTASIKLKLYQQAKSGKRKEIDNHELLDLLARPNPSQSGDEFRRALVSYYLISGNSYVFGNGIDPMQKKPKPPTELQLLNPGKMQLKPPSTGMFPLYYEYRPTAQVSTQFPVEQVSGRSAILHLKTFSPVSPWYGLPPMLAAAFGIDIHNSGQKWNKKLLDNNCRPAGAIMVKDKDGNAKELSDDQYQRLREMIDNAYSGANNAGRPMLLEGGLDWKEMSINPKDLDFLKGKESAARDIGLIFGVPPQLLGIEGSQTFANFEQANLSFWTDTVIPLNDWVLDALNRWLVPMYGEDLVLTYDKDSIDALEPMRKEKFSRVQGAEFMTIAEKRRAVGLDDFGLMDDALVLTGRGVLLGPDGSIVPLSAPAPLDPSQDPLSGGTPPTTVAKRRQWLIDNGYTPERAERLAKQMYG